MRYILPFHVPVSPWKSTWSYHNVYSILLVKYTTNDILDLKLLYNTSRVETQILCTSLKGKTFESPLNLRHLYLDPYLRSHRLISEGHDFGSDIKPPSTFEAFNL